MVVMSVDSRVLMLAMLMAGSTVRMMVD